MFEGITLATLLTAAGAGIAAVIVTLTVDVWKAMFASIPKLAGIDGILMAGLFSLLLYLVVAIDASTDGFSLGEGFGVFLAWLTCAAAAVGVHKAVTKPIAKAFSGGDV